MASTSFELMQNHVRAIYRALTGQELPEPTSTGVAPSLEEVTRRFAALEGLSRRLPLVAERVPPYSFHPPLDVLQTERELVVEIGVPGIEKHDIDAEIVGSVLTVSGSRVDLGEGRTYYHAELPRGPFRRTVQLPLPVTGEPRVEVENGIIRVRLTRKQRTVPAKA